MNASFTDALQNLEALLAAAPGDANALELRAAIHLAAEDPAAAAETLRAAIVASPEPGRVSAELAAALVRAGDFDAADRVLARANPPAGARSNAPRERSANIDFVNAIERAPAVENRDLQTDLLRGAIQLDRQQFDEALALADELARRFPDSPLTHQLAGSAHEGARQHESGN